MTDAAALRAGDEVPVLIGRWTYYATIKHLANMAGPLVAVLTTAPAEGQPVPEEWFA